MKKSLMTFLLLFNSLVRLYSFAVMVTVRQFFTILFYESQVEQLRKLITQEKKYF